MEPILNRWSWFDRGCVRLRRFLASSGCNKATRDQEGMVRTLEKMTLQHQLPKFLPSGLFLKWGKNRTEEPPCKCTLEYGSLGPQGSWRESRAAGDPRLCHLSIPPLPPPPAEQIALLLNQAWVCLPMHSKANLLTLGCGEGKCSVYCRSQARSPKDLNSPVAFRERFLKTG